MLIYSFITDYQAFNLRYKDNTARDKNETKVGKQSANLGKNNEPIQNRLSFLIVCKSVILHHLTILSFPMVRPAWDNWWLLSEECEYKEYCAQQETGKDWLYCSERNDIIHHLLQGKPICSGRTLFLKHADAPDGSGHQYEDLEPEEEIISLSWFESIHIYVSICFHVLTAWKSTSVNGMNGVVYTVYRGNRVILPKSFV